MRTRAASASLRTSTKVAASRGRSRPGTIFSSGSNITMSAPPWTFLLDARFGRGARAFARRFLRQLETQAAGERCRFRQSDRHNIAELVSRTRPVADHGVAPLIVPEVLAAQRAGRQEAFRAGVGEPQEETEARDTRDASLERRADTILHKRSDIAIGGVALRRHRAPLGRRDVFCDLAHPRHLAIAETVGAEFQRPDQRAVYDKIGVAPERRGEMCIALQVQSEMADIFRVIDSLRLGAQHDVVHHLLVRAAFRVDENAVDGSRFDDLSLG